MYTQTTTQPYADVSRTVLAHDDLPNFTVQYDERTDAPSETEVLLQRGDLRLVSFQHHYAKGAAHELMTVLVQAYEMGRRDASTAMVE